MTLKLKIISLLRIVKQTHKRARTKKYDYPEILLHDETSRHFLMDKGSKSYSSKSFSLFPILPDEVQLEILSFVYDEIESIEIIFDSQGGRCNFFDHIYREYFARSILQSARYDEIFCKICSNPLCYPYQLVDPGCAHAVCGMCVFKCREELGSCCPCGVRLRSRPKRLGNYLADCRAYWLLDQVENYKLYEKNETRLFRGVSGYFGRNGTNNYFDPFCFVGFEADFDYLETFDIRNEELDLKKSLPKKCGRLFILLCPAHENYSPYYIEDFDPKEFDSRVFANREWLLHISNEDMITLEEEELGKNCKRDRVEIRLTGWEQSVGTAADYAF